MDNTVKFTGKAENYTKFRPSYPKEYLDYLVNECSIRKTSVVADVGAGTGIFTKSLLEKECTVIAVEPNVDMRNAAQEFLNGYDKLTLVNGTDENTTILSHSVDLITAAQAFHWFDAEKFKLECRRILKPNAKVALVWNSRDSHSEFVMETSGICHRLCPDFHGFSGGISSCSDEIFALFFKESKYDYKQFSNNLEYDLDGFIGRNLSASYAPKENDKNYEEFIFEMKQHFQKYSNNGKVIVPNKTNSYIGEV